MQVLPGARLPVDGDVLSGTSHADEAMLTGEAAPVPKRVGSAVIGGTINLGGTLVVCPPFALPACHLRAALFQAAGALHKLSQHMSLVASWRVQ